MAFRAKRQDFEPSRFYLGLNVERVSFRGHKKLEPRPDWSSFRGFSKFPTSIPVCFIWQVPRSPSINVAVFGTAPEENSKEF